MLKKFGWTYLLVAFFMALSLLVGCGGGGGGGGGGASDPVIETQLGDMTCVDEGTMIACRGIPYAAPPVGNLRFAPPAAHAGWTGTLEARTFRSACVQDNGTGSEDCLFLNVFFPEDAQPGDDLPVMVWIHGGAFIQGAGSVPGYDVPALVNEGVIVVTINYRLNAFGFLPHPALEDPTGNFGLKDQVFALQWVQANIGDFGGNPGNVTIFGESAGGHSVLSLLVSNIRDRDPRLFHKAIVQSGSYSPTQTALGTVGYYGLGLPFADLLGGYPSGAGTGPCSVANCPAGQTCNTNEGIRACLRGLTVAQIIAAQKAGPAWAWITPVHAAGTFLPQSINSSLAAGGTNVANVPIMIGSNLNEGSLFTALFMSGYNNFDSVTDLWNGVTTLLATDPRVYDRGSVAASYAHWATTTYGDNLNKHRNAHSMVFTDATFNCPNMAQWSQLLTAGRSVYAYWFTDADAPIPPAYAALGALSPLFNLGNKGFGASHSFEIQYIFGHVRTHAAVTSAQVDLSNRMIAYWTNFAKDGAPGGEWTPFVGTNIRELYPGGDSNATATDFMGAHYCAYWANPEGLWPVVQ